MRVPADLRGARPWILGCFSLAPALLISCGATSMHASPTAPTDLGGVLRVDFPGTPTQSVSTITVNGSPVTVSTATYVEPVTVHAFDHSETPLLMQARVVSLDGEMHAMETPDVAGLCDDIGARLGEGGVVIASSHANTAGAPGCAFEVDVPRPIPGGSPRLLRRPAAHVSLRVLVGPRSASILVSAFWRGRLFESDPRRDELNRFLQSARTVVPEPAVASHQPVSEPTQRGEETLAGVLLGAPVRIDLPAGD